MPRKTNSNKESAAGKGSGEKSFLKVDSFEIGKVREVNTKNGGVLNFANVTINGVTIYDCRAVTYKDQEGKERDFLAFPEEKGSDGNYYKRAYAPLSSEDQQRICDAIYAKLDNPD